MIGRYAKQRIGRVGKEKFLSRANIKRIPGARSGDWFNVDELVESGHDLLWRNSRRLLYKLILLFHLFILYIFLTAALGSSDAMESVG